METSNVQPNTMNIPNVGDITTIHGKLCEIIAVYKFGTIDVKTLDGNNNCFRVTGLAFVK